MKMYVFIRFKCAQAHSIRLGSRVVKSWCLRRLFVGMRSAHYHWFGYADNSIAWNSPLEWFMYPEQQQITRRIGRSAQLGSSIGCEPCAGDQTCP